MSQPYFPAPELLSIRLAWAARHVYVPGLVHFSPQVSTSFVWHLLEGQLQVDTPGSSFRVEPGDWVWHPACGERRMEAGARGATWLSVGLSARCGGVDWFAPGEKRAFRPEAAESAYGRSLLEWLRHATVEGVALERDGLARALGGWLWRVSGAPSRPHFPDWLEAALGRIEHEPDVSVALLAQEAHFSPAQFRRLWERYLGVSPRDFLMERRLERAQGLIEGENGGVAQVALRCGFGSAAALSRAFVARTGMTPLEWRRAARERV